MQQSATKEKQLLKNDMNILEQKPKNIIKWSSYVVRDVLPVVSIKIRVFLNWTQFKDKSFFENRS